MLFSASSHLAIALAVSLVTATPLSVPAPVSQRSLDLVKPVSVHVGLDHEWSGEALVEDVIADAALPPIAAVGAEIDLAVICKKCFTRGDINATVSLQNLVPALSLSLTDIEAYLDLEVRLGLATTIAVNLFTPAAPIQLSLAGLKVSALIFLDLVLSVDAAIDFTGGIWITIAEKALLETDILSGELLETNFSGLSVKTIPIEVQIGCATLQADLRLRVQLAAEVDVDASDLLDLGLDLPEIGAGLELGVYANLVEYIGLLCDTPSCPVSEESYGLNVGATVELDVEVEDILTLALAPTISTTILTLPTVTICERGPRATESLTVSASLSGVIGSATGSISASSTSGSASVTTSSAEVSAIGSGSVSGYVTSTVQATTTYAYTICATQVANCPANYQSGYTITKTVDVYTTVCPATMSLTAPVTSSLTTFTASPRTTITTDATLLVPCSSVKTFTSPTGVLTVPAKPTSSVYASATSTTVYSMTTTGTASYSASQSHSSYPTSSSNTAPISLSYPAYTGSQIKSSSAPYPTYLVSSQGHSNGTYPQSSTRSDKPSASKYYPTSSIYPTITYPVTTYPTATPVTAGADKVVNNVMSLLVVVAAGVVIW